MATSDPVIIRKARLSDIGELCDLFLDLSPTVKRFFHPFRFNKLIAKTWFLMMVISQKMLTVLKKTIPKLAFILLIAYDIEQSQILGFIFLEITGKLSEGFVANIGLTTREGARGMGIGSIGTKMYMHIIEYAKEVGVKKFRIMILEDNLATIMLTKRIGFKFKGFTTDQWEGKDERAQIWELEL